MANIISKNNYDISLGESNTEQYKKFKVIVLELVNTVLTEKQRRYINLRYFEQLQVKEIAEICGVNSSTVTRGIQGAIRRLGAYGTFFFLPCD